MADVAQTFHDLDGRVNASAVSDLMSKANLLSRAAGNENADAIRASLKQLIDLGVAAQELAPVAKAAEAALPVLKRLEYKIDRLQLDLFSNVDHPKSELSLTQKLGKVWQELSVALEARTIPVVTMQKIEVLRQSVATMLDSLRVIVDREESRLQTLRNDALEAVQMRISANKVWRKELKKSLTERNWEAVAEIFPQAVGTSAQLSVRFQECLKSSDVPLDQHLALLTAFDLLSHNACLTLQSQQSSEYPYRELQASISQSLNRSKIARHLHEQARTVEQFAVLTGTALFLEGGISASDNEWSSIFHGVPKNQQDTYVSLLKDLRPNGALFTIAGDLISIPEGIPPSAEQLREAQCLLHNFVYQAKESYRTLIELEQKKQDHVGLSAMQNGTQNEEMATKALSFLLHVLYYNINFDARTSELLKCTQSRADLLWEMIQSATIVIRDESQLSVFGKMIAAEQALRLIEILESRQQ